MKNYYLSLVLFVVLAVGFAFPCYGVLEEANVSSSLGFGGAKVHVVIPVPQVSPFIEVGIGGAAGVLTTSISDLYDEKMQGATFHIPFAIGLGFGERRNFELTF